jgi:hypothetical protein
MIPGQGKRTAESGERKDEADDGFEDDGLPFETRQVDWLVLWRC